MTELPMSWTFHMFIVAWLGTSQVFQLTLSVDSAVFSLISNLFWPFGLWWWRLTTPKTENTPAKVFSVDKNYGVSCWRKNKVSLTVRELVMPQIRVLHMGYCILVILYYPDANRQIKSRSFIMQHKDGDMLSSNICIVSTTKGTKGCRWLC